MKRVVTAIQKGRCVLIAGSRVQSEPASRAALAEHPGLPIHHLGARDLSADDLAPVIGRQGGLLVLIEPDARADGRALEQLASLLKKSKAKPNVLMVAPIFNPFGLPMALRLMRVEHEKAKAADLLGGLPVSAPQSEPMIARLKGQPVSDRRRSIEMTTMSAVSTRKNSPTCHMFCSSSRNQNAR